LFSVRIFDDKLLSSLESALGIDLFNDVAFDFEKTLAQYSGVITTPSSIAITAMYHKRSVALLVYRDKPMLMQSGWLIPSSAIFEINLNSFLSLSPQRMAIQTDILKSYLVEKGVTDLIDTIIHEENTHDLLQQQHINTSMRNMLNSHFNFNIEWWVRNLYMKVKKNKLVRKLRLTIR
jgi:hypothetical protein